jgi:hypothetical protein
MTTRLLGDLAAAVKSANAGASWLTFDLRFDDEAAYQLVATSGAISAERFHQLYDVPAEDVTIYLYAPALTIKVTVPRRTLTGGIAETDFDGVQQFAPLLGIPIEDHRG